MLLWLLLHVAVGTMRLAAAAVWSPLALPFRLLRRFRTTSPLQHIKNVF